MNRGDTFPIDLNYRINGIPIEEYGLDEIEFTLGTKSYKLSAGEITLDQTTGKYVLWIGQTDSLKLKEDNDYQIRFRKGTEVTSTDPLIMIIGRGLSNNEI